MRLNYCQHSGVTEGVLFNASEIQKLGNAVVVGANQLGKGFRINRHIRDFLETVFGKELCFEGEAKDSGYIQSLRSLEQSRNQKVANALPSKIIANNQRTNLGQVFPHNVYRSCPNYFTGIVHSHQKLWHFFKKRNQFQLEQFATRTFVRLPEACDSTNVRRGGRTYVEVRGGHP